MLDKNIPLLSYVIMPNHFHGIIHIPESSKLTINQIIANAKRFLSYEIIKRLKEGKELKTLKILKEAVSESDSAKNQKHKVFKYSFDCKEIFDMPMMLTKVDYIHKNPCQAKWSLVEDFTKYPHSSAAFYEREEPNRYVQNYFNFE